MTVKFVIPGSILHKIAKVYGKSDYDKNGNKVMIARDFIIEVSGLDLTFIEIDDQLLCYSKINVNLPEEICKRKDDFQDGIIPFDSVQIFKNVARMIPGTATVVVEYDEKSNVIDLVFEKGKAVKTINIKTTKLSENKSFATYKLASERYFMENDSPYGIDPEGNKLNYSNIIHIDSEYIKDIVSDGNKNNARNFIIKLINENQAILSAKNSATKMNTIKEIESNIPIKSDTFVAVERGIGFGFSHLSQLLENQTTIYYTTENKGTCILKNEGKEFGIHALLNFNDPSTNVVSRKPEEFVQEISEDEFDEDEDEDDFDEDDDSDEDGDLEE